MKAIFKLNIEMNFLFEILYLLYFRVIPANIQRVYYIAQSMLLKTLSYKKMQRIMMLHLVLH